MGQKDLPVEILSVGKANVELGLGKLNLSQSKFQLIHLT
jgi:hypothetical protein